MKKIFFALIVTFLLSTPCLAGEWDLTGSLNQGRSQFCSVMLDDGRVLVAGGCNSGELSSCEIYDSNTGQWSPTDSMYCLRRDFSLTKLSNGKILATGGYNGGIGLSTTISEIYDPQTGIWTTSGELNYFRGHHTTILLQNNKVLVIGGDAVNGYKGCEIYDFETEIFTLTGFCSYAKTNHTIELLPDGRVMAIGGGNSSYEYCEIYDPSTEIWTEIDDLNEPRFSHTSHLLPNNNVMVIAGCWGNHYNSSCEIYDFQTQQWTFADSLEIGRTNHCSEKLLNNKILAMGGWNDGYLSNCENYDWQTSEWEPETPMPHLRANFSSEILIDERVIAIGPYYCDLYNWNHTPIVSQPQTLSGLNEALVGDMLTFSVTATDPDNDSVAVRIDWGDGEISDWTGIQSSGSTFILSHSWNKCGTTYKVRAQSVDQWYFLNELCHNSISEWGDTLLVTIHGQAVDPSYGHAPIMSAYPNPFNHTTTISFYGTVNSHENARIDIYNIKGQLVRTFTPFPNRGLGAREVVWDGTDETGMPVGSGIYFFTFKLGEEIKASNKMLFFR